MSLPFKQAASLPRRRQHAALPKDGNQQRLEPSQALRASQFGKTAVLHTPKEIQAVQSDTSESGTTLEALKVKAKPKWKVLARCLLACILSSMIDRK